MKEMTVRIMFKEDVLGSASGNPEIHREFIASKAPDAQNREEEVEALGIDEVEKKEMTVFPRMEDGRPCFWDYQIRGFFKSACGMLRNVTGTKSAGIKAYKKFIDGLVFVNERKIPIEFDLETMNNCQRPLRGQTAQGERIALANSEQIPAGATCTFTIRVLKDDLMPVVREWMDYGQYNGLGCWRNSGKGRFFWEELDENGQRIGGNMAKASWSAA